MLKMNHMGVLMNPNQGKSKRVLCVCTAGILRSATAAKVLHTSYGYNTRACGAETEIALIPLSPGLVYWADEIVCMSPGHRAAVDAILLELGENRKVLTLGVPDMYPYMNEVLKEEIINRYEKELKENDTARASG